MGREFLTSRKTEFTNHVLQQGAAEYFTHFQNLYHTVGEILELQAKPQELYVLETASTDQVLAFQRHLSTPYRLCVAGFPLRLNCRSIPVTLVRKLSICLLTP